MATSHPSSEELAGRLSRAADGAAARGIDALLVTPGPDLRYLTGYDAVALERLTCLILRSDGTIAVVVPRLERTAAGASPLGGLDVELLSWDETDDPYALVAAQLRPTAVVGLDDHMWAQKVLGLREAMPQATQTLAGEVLRELRMRKTPAEVDSLRRAGAAIDAVHERVPDFLRPGRTEREVGTDIADAILEAGHARVDFVIVGSGPNGASPHHELSDRVIEVHEPVVVDIGGTMPDGYCSDSTRTYAVGTPPLEFLEYYAVLHRAQQASCHAVRPGATCEEIDRAARDVIAQEGYGDLFIHRTGHGIGLETHEDPYIVKGNELPLEPGMAFSIEPGIYVAGAHGARIEDIVVCTDDGGERLNLTSRDLVVL